MPKSSRDQHKILVVGLPPGSSSTDLIKLVKPYGNPLNAHMAVDAEGKERGFGFVQFSDASTQQSAIAALDKTALAGRTLNVRAVEERAPGGGSFSGRGGVGGSAATGKNKGRPCYDFARGMCARGASCKWAHMAPKRGGNVEVAAADGEPAAEEAANSRRPEWQKKRAHAGSDASYADILSGIPDDYCRKYQLGTCHRGNSCKWKHIVWKGGAGAAAATGAGEASPGSAKRARAAEESARPAGGATASAAAATTGGNSATARIGAPLMGGGASASGGETAAELRALIKQREGEWRAAHPEHPTKEAVPLEAKRRDVVWKALERKLQRAEEREGTARASE